MCHLIVNQDGNKIFIQYNYVHIQVQIYLKEVVKLTKHKKFLFIELLLLFSARCLWGKPFMVRPPCEKNFIKNFLIAIIIISLSLLQKICRKTSAV